MQNSHVSMKTDGNVTAWNDSRQRYGLYMFDSKQNYKSNEVKNKKENAKQVK